MRAIVAILALSALLSAAPASMAGPTTATSPAPQAAICTVDLELVKGYAARLGIIGQASESGMLGRVVFDGRTFDLLLSADPAACLCYLALLDLCELKADDPKRAVVLQRAMELNYELAMGKLEWDRKAGTIRLSHSFSTESGLSYEQFRGVLLTLLSAAQPLRSELKSAR
ncbi:MAG: YbjN domain-containing protein [Candidatus Alcyoniella australis]|nr:YbjN domain-containing protein [Candidatus Alcyoniella australis]